MLRPPLRAAHLATCTPRTTHRRVATPHSSSRGSSCSIVASAPRRGHDARRSGSLHVGRGVQSRRQRYQDSGNGWTTDSCKCLHERPKATCFSQSMTQGRCTLGRARKPNARCSPRARGHDTHTISFPRSAHARQDPPHDARFRFRSRADDEMSPSTHTRETRSALRLESHDVAFMARARTRQVRRATHAAALSPSPFAALAITAKPRAHVGLCTSLSTATQHIKISNPCTAQSMAASPVIPIARSRELEPRREPSTTRSTSQRRDDRSNVQAQRDLATSMTA